MLGKSACYININNFLTNKFFISNQLMSTKIKYYFQSELTGSTIKNLSLKTIKNTLIILPSKQEQEKIASFLTQVDTKIEQLTKKAKLLSDYKKGTMQKIFSQEIRFKDENGKDYPSWEEKKLGDVLLINRGASPRPIDKFITNDVNAINWIKIGDIKEGDKYIYSTKERITKIGAKKSRAIEPDDFILSNSMSFGRPYISKFMDVYTMVGYY